MVFSRRFLRVAALGAVFALGLAGTALAAPTTYTWQGGASGHEKDWAQNDNWLPNTGYPGSDASEDGDIAVIGPSAEVELGDNKTVATVDLGDDAKLTITANKLTIKNGELRASGNATVTSKAAAGLTFDTTNNVAVSADKTLTLAAEGAGATIVGDAAAALKLTNGGNAAGTLVLAAPVTTVKKLDIEDGGTVVVGVNDALPGYDEANLTITKGSLVINGENFGKKGGAADLDTLTLTEGDLTLNKAMHTTAKKVVIKKGTLTVGSGVEKIGSEVDSELTLGVASTSAGHLVLLGNLSIGKLKTETGVDSTINTNGKTLTVADADNPFTLNAEVKGDDGTLILSGSAALTVTLNKKVAGTVQVSVPNGVVSSLEAKEDVGAVEFTSGGTATSATLKLAANKDIGTLSFEKASDFVAELAGNNTIEKLNLNAPVPLKVKSSSGGNTIGFLAPVDGAKLEMDTTGQALLSIKNGAAGLSEVKLQTGTKLALGDKALLQKTTSMALGSGSELTLPSGEFPDLKLHATANGAAISVDVAAQDPVLKVKEIEVGNTQTLTVNRPDTWCLTLSGDVTLLTAPTVTLTGSGTMKGAPESDDVALIKLNTTKTALILTPRAGLKFPVLKGTPTSSGNQCNVLVKVVDGKVDAASWEWELNVLPLGSATHSILAAGTTESVLYGVQLADNFQSGFLRVRAKKAGSTVCGVVDVPLKRGAVGGTPDSGKVGADLKKPESWSRTAISGDSVVLTSKLKLDGTPKSLKVKASGMKNEPKAELLDAAGKVVAKSSVPSVSAVKDYTLKLTCKTTKAEIDKGAKIEQVTVTMSDGKTHTIPVNVKLSDMKIGTPDTKKPGGDNGGGKTPGGDNGGGKNPGGEDGGGKNPGGEDGGKKGSSGGGCDAGFGGVALALGAAFLLKRKA